VLDLSNEKWPQIMAETIGLVAASASLVTMFAEKLICTKPTFSTTVFDTGGFIRRPELESKIMKIYDREQTQLKKDVYFVVFGAAGVGKSTLIANVMNNKDGIVAVHVHQGVSAGMLFQMIERACSITEGQSLSQNDIVAALLTASGLRTDKKRITLVLEVERGGNIDDARGVLAAVKQVAKACAECANVIIVLSEANAALGFTDDNRAKFLYVGEMKMDEAREYFNHLTKGSELTIEESKLSTFFDKIGTSPMQIKNFADAMDDGDVSSVDSYIEDVLTTAVADLAGFVHTPILEALKENPDGVKSSDFIDVEYKGKSLSQPIDVAEAMKRSKAIVYDIPHCEYRLSSKAHATALATMSLKRRRLNSDGVTSLG
jgi:hypothetical protein